MANSRSDNPQLSEGETGHRQQTATARPRIPWLWFLIVLVANYLAVTLLFPEGSEREDVPYMFFTQQVQAGNVAEVVSKGDTIQGTFR